MGVGLVSWALAAAVAAQSPSAADPGAQPDSDNPGTIVVTGERVRRSLKDTPSSVHVTTGRELEAQPVDTVEQVLAFIPNVQLGHGSQGPAIRGQDTTGPLQALPAFLGGNRPQTTLVVDGRPDTYHEFVFGAAPVWDVQRIEVFRSPQTTTQGQNSIAGAIFVWTGDPGPEPEYRVRGIAGNFDTRQLSAVASAPLTGDIALRVSGDLRYAHTTSHIVDGIEGASPNHDVYGLIRTKLLVRPAALPNTRLLLTYSHLQSQSPQIVGVTEPLRERRDENGGYGVFRIKVDSLTASVHHEAGPLTANLLLSAGDSLAKRLALPGFGQARIDGRDWSGEAVLNWRSDGPLRATAGLSHRHTAQRQIIDLSVLLGIPRFRDWQDGTGLFGEISYRVTDRATLTGGLRYQRDRQKRIGAFETASRPIDLDYDRSFHAWLPKVSFAYDVSSAVTAGVLVERAYNPGGTTLRFDSGEPDNFEAESLWDYEIFSRAELPARGLAVTANAFYYDMRNAQRAKDIRILAPNGRFVGFSDLFNVPKAHSYGAEVEMQWRASGRLSLAGGIGLLRSKIVRVPAGYEEFEGLQFDRSPHLTASASIDWRPTQRLQLSAQVRHHSRYMNDPSSDALLTQTEAATIADARAEYRLGHWSLFGYARNVFDTFAVISRDPFSATLEDPREVGIGVDARF